MSEQLQRIAVVAVAVGSINALIWSGAIPKIWNRLLRVITRTQQR